VLCGATSQIPNFSTRIKNELEDACPTSLKANFIVPPEEDLAWMVSIGGTVLTHIASGLPDFWISKEEYDEFGSSIVTRKCF
jgi:actin-related protein